MADRPAHDSGPAAPVRAPAPSLSGADSAVIDVWLAHAPGDRIADKYQLIRKLDQGGMGVVWIAHHLGLDIHVALKLIRPEVDSPDAAERLVVEAQAAARLDHPAIVHVLDVGRTASGDPFLVMELLEGESVADLIDRESRVDVVTAIQLILPIVGALGAMHAKGILHRDIKPENIFLACDDEGRWQPKLIDFGLARLDARARPNRITRRGMVVGTPLYLSAERMRGAEADPRDDVWALCVVLYEMVTGSHPFRAKNARELLVALVANKPRSLAEHGIDEPELARILTRGMSPRSACWPSSRELGRALAQALWARGITQDICEVSLQSHWLDEASLRPASSPKLSASQATPSRSRRPASQIVTTRIHRAPMGPGAPAAPAARVAPVAPMSPADALPSPTPDSAPDAAVTSPRERPAKVTSEPGDEVRPAPPRLARGIVLVLLGMSIGLVVGVVVGRRTVTATVIVAARAPEPAATAVTTEVEAGAAPPAEVSARAVEASTSAAPPRPRPRAPRGAASAEGPGSGLKDPFRK